MGTPSPETPREPVDLLRVEKSIMYGPVDGAIPRTSRPAHRNVPSHWSGWHATFSYSARLERQNWARPKDGNTHGTRLGQRPRAYPRRDKIRFAGPRIPSVPYSHFSGINIQVSMTETNRGAPSRGKQAADSFACPAFSYRAGCYMTAWQAGSCRVLSKAENEDENSGLC